MTQNSSESSLRIIGGKWRGRKVSFSDHSEIRPTPDRVRETLFNWLAPHIRNANCLDLFAGSGILAIEALSRGAAQASIIDISTGHISHIRTILSSLDAENGSCSVADAFQWLNSSRADEFEAFDLVFLDPPFAFKSEEIYTLTTRLHLSRRIEPNGLVYVETAESLDATKLPEPWVIRKQKKAGKVHYCLCQVKP